MNCRICFEGNEEQPLLQPCKCTGSIGHIHESCLMTWLTVKQSNSCELCKSPYQTVYNRPLEDHPEINLLQGYFLVYPSWHILNSCILQIILSKFMIVPADISYFYAQVLYHSCYIPISLGALAATLRSPRIYLKYLMDTGLPFVLFLHMHIWSWLLSLYQFKHTGYTLFMILSIINQCYLGIYPFLHSRAIQQMNQERTRVLV